MLSGDLKFYTHPPIPLSEINFMLPKLLFHISSFFNLQYSNIVLLMSKQYQPDHWMREERISKFLFQNSILQFEDSQSDFFFRLLWLKGTLKATELRTKNSYGTAKEEVCISHYWTSAPRSDSFSVAELSMSVLGQMKFNNAFYSIKPWTGTVFVIVGAETLLSYLTYWHTIHDRRAGRKEHLLLYMTAGRKGSSIEVRGRTQGWSFASLATKYLAPHPTKNSVSDAVEVTSPKSTDSFFSCVCDNFINFVLPAKTKD